MITFLDIKNFKCFSSLNLRLGALTLLTGFNAGGKSSAVQPLLLLSQGSRHGLQTKRLSLNGSLVRLGAVGDVLPSATSTSSFAVEISTTHSKAKWVLSGRSGERYVNLAEETVTQLNTDSPSNPADIEYFQNVLRSLSYISAVREGAEDSYPLPDFDHEGVVDVGIDGRFAAYWYTQYVDEEVPESRRHPDEPASSLRKQADAWFSTLFPKAQVNVQHIVQVASESLQFRLSEFGDWRRPANVGYGFTYVFPILVALLTAKSGQVLVIDSPEAHLHPTAQSKMGRLLATFASTGVQIIVETHSDHLLNGARLAVKDGQLTPDDLAIHFFTGADQSEHGVLSPAIDINGKLSDWPEGFFDQAEKDLAQLSGWNI